MQSDLQLQWVINRANDHDPVEMLELRLFMGAMRDCRKRAQAESRGEVYTDKGIAGKAVAKRWLKRNGLELKQATMREMRRTMAEEDIASVKKLFDDLEELITRLAITDQQLLAADETGVNASDRLLRNVVVQQGCPATRHEQKCQQYHVSIMHTAVGDGQTLPPITIFKGKNIPADALKHAPPGSVMQVQDNGYFEARHFIEFLKHIILHHNPSRPEELASKMVEVEHQEIWRTPEGKLETITTTSKTFPRILIIDNAAQHRHPMALEYAKGHHIHILYLPPNMTHLMQVSVLDHHAQCVGRSCQES